MFETHTHTQKDIKFVDVYYDQTAFQSSKAPTFHWIPCSCQKKSNSLKRDWFGDEEAGARCHQLFRRVNEAFENENSTRPLRIVMGLAMTMSDHAAHRGKRWLVFRQERWALYLICHSSLDSSISLVFGMRCRKDF